MSHLEDRPAQPARIRTEDWDRLEVPEPYRAEIVRGEPVATRPGSVFRGQVQVMLGAHFTWFAPETLWVAANVVWRSREDGRFGTTSKWISRPASRP